MYGWLCFTLNAAFFYLVWVCLPTSFYYILVSLFNYSMGYYNSLPLEASSPSSTHIYTCFCTSLSLPISPFSAIVYFSLFFYLLYLFPYCLLWICLLFLSHSLFLLTCLPVSIQPPPCLPPLTIWLVSPFNVDFGQSSKISQSPKRSYRNINIPSAKTGKACTKKEIKRKRDYKNS